MTKKTKKIVLTDVATTQLLHSSVALQALLEENDFDNLDPDQMSDAMMNLERLFALMSAITEKAGIDISSPPEEFIEGSVEVIED